MKSELFPPYAVLLSLASLCSARSFFTRMFALPVLAGATVLVVATGAGVAAGATVQVSSGSALQPFQMDPISEGKLDPSPLSQVCPSGRLDSRLTKLRSKLTSRAEPQPFFITPISLREIGVMFAESSFPEGKT